MIEALAFKYRTGTPGTDLPERFGLWKGVHHRLRKWAIDGTREQVFTALLAGADAEDGLDWVIAVDSTIVRAHPNMPMSPGVGNGAAASWPEPDLMCERPMRRNGRIT
ncbi:hypothetical protein GCM10009544_67320 [Streptomyces stramineus]|uniref:Transposase n=1 Tax=Streptomyces stramineus TaxID=173861 RepID=A0ABN1BKL5_9ACTN